MSRLLFWIPDSFMIVAIAVIALGLIVGLIRPRRAVSLIGLIVLLLLSGPFVDALLGFVWSALPLWLILLALPVVLLAVVRGAFRFLLGSRVTDHMTGILAATAVLWGIRKGFQLVTFPFRVVLRRLS
jgi:hypothetical protein